MKSRNSIFVVLISASLLLFSTIVAASAPVAFAYKQTQNVDNITRIVSAGRSTTEILYALGVQQQIVAVDTSSKTNKRILVSHTKFQKTIACVMQW